MTTPVRLGDLPLGVMQGRLLPKYQGRYQAHPVGNWAEEFPLAAGLGLDCIEFILDFDGAEDNPLLSAGGCERIQAATAASGVTVRTICADYFMEAPLHVADAAAAGRSAAVMRRLLRTARTLGVTDVVLPCVDQSSLRDADAVERFVVQVTALLDEATALGVNLSLETDLAPEPFAELLDRFDSPRVTVNYDTGNSASLGYDPSVEFACYGDRISDVHIKDRVLGGGSVPLGTGDARLRRVFAGLEALGYRGPLVLQAYRDEEGLGILGRQLTWLREHLLVRGRT